MKIRTKLYLGLFIFLCILVPSMHSSVLAQSSCAAQSGKCLYVAVNGNTNGTGTIDNPFFYIEDAVSAAQPGDIIYLRGGTYGDERKACSSAWGGSSLIAIEDTAVWNNCGHVSSANSGTAQAPITISSYPGEHAILNPTSSYNIVAASSKSFWIIENLEIVTGGSLVWSGAHDITFQNNDIHGQSGCCENNTGMIEVYQSYGGPASYNVVIQNNSFHDMSEIGGGVNQTWDQADDAIHIAAITVLSCEVYFPYPCGGTGAITIRGNEIYRVPQAVFIKNPMPGPTLVQGNIFHDIQFVSNEDGSNFTFDHNLVYNTTRGYLFGAFGDEEGLDPNVVNDTGRNLKVTNNTLVGLSGIVEFDGIATGHTITNNLMFGADSHVGPYWDNAAVYGKRVNGQLALADSAFNDTNDPDPTKSTLARGNNFNNNCFIFPDADFELVKRNYWDYTTNAGSNEFGYTLPQSQTFFGFDTRSIFVQHATSNSDETAIFNNPSANDFSISPSGPAAGCASLVPAPPIPTNVGPSTISTGSNSLSPTPASPNNPIVPVTPFTPPQAPLSFTGSVLSPSQITLSWQLVAGASGYKVYRNNQIVSNTTDTTFQDSSLAPATAYIYQVSAYNSFGDSAQTSALSFTTLPAGSAATPSAPSPTDDPLQDVVTLILNNRALFTKAQTLGITVPPLILKVLTTGTLTQADLDGTASVQITSPTKTIPTATAPVTALPSTTINLSSITRTLQLNYLGTDVILLQDFLIQENKGPEAASLKVHGANGSFGPLTKLALEEYQKAAGVPATGVFDSNTKAKTRGN